MPFLKTSFESLAPILAATRLHVSSLDYSVSWEYGGERLGGRWLMQMQKKCMLMMIGLVRIRSCWAGVTSQARAMLNADKAKGCQQPSAFVGTYLDRLLYIGRGGQVISAATCDCSMQSLGYRFYRTILATVSFDYLFSECRTVTFQWSTPLTHNEPDTGPLSRELCCAFAELTTSTPLCQCCCLLRISGVGLAITSHRQIQRASGLERLNHPTECSH